MNLIDELIERGVARSRRQLSKMLGRSPNYICENRGFGPEDLVHLRLQLIDRGGHADLIEQVEHMLLTQWWDIP